MEKWNNGVLEKWNSGVMNLQYSNTPSL